MKNKIIFSLMLLVALASCTKDNPATPANSLNGTWKLTRYHDITAGTNESEPANISRSIIMNFSSNDTSANVDGHTVMNTVSGAYELPGNNKMRTLIFGGSKVGEPSWGHKFWNAMNATSSYKIEAGKLYIYFNADNEKMEFEKQ